MKSRNSGFLVWIRLTLLVTAAALGILAIARDWSGFVEGLEAIGPLNGFAGLLLIVAGLFASVEVWREALMAVAGPLNRRDARRIFFPSQLGKYLPGGVWTILAQIERAGQYGLSYSRVGVGAVLFLVFHLITGLIVVTAVLPWAAPDLFERYWWTLTLAPLLLWLLTPRGLVIATNWLLTVLRSQRLEAHLAPKEVVKPSLWMIVVWLMYGTSMWVLLRPLAESSDQANLLALATGVFALAWLVGVVVVIAPAGLGAREVVLFLALSPLVGDAAATSLAITLRVLHTVADMALAGWEGRQSRVSVAQGEDAPG